MHSAHRSARSGGDYWPRAIAFGYVNGTPDAEGVAVSEEYRSDSPGGGMIVNGVVSGKPLHVRLS